MKRRGFTQATGTVVALVVIGLGIAAGVFYQDNASHLSRTGEQVTTTLTTSANGTVSTVTTTLVSTILSTVTSTVIQGSSTVTSTVTATTTSQTVTTVFEPTTVTSTYSAVTTSTATTTATSTATSTTTSFQTTVSTSTTTATISSTVTSTVTTTPTPPPYVLMSGSVSSKSGTLTGIDFNGASNGMVSGTINGGSYTVSLPNPDTYTVVIDYYQGSAKTCTAGTAVISQETSGPPVAANWSC